MVKRAFPVMWGIRLSDRKLSSLLNSSGNTAQIALTKPSTAIP